ncbi:LOW QUALITY PROTEIN: selenoprotein V [Heterocephalus glaber]|uniref:LOW QUALITY PROTEIN: selenoprotein V n=1 Tax=Heterocephalus glaber TaxID=10181 RepID=A0AAX6RH72_HETGA|nr:LOW QUALITY PROTEIN: selenoprotein V [Heterocephalus glaber]
MNHQGRAPAPSPARHSTPVRTSISSRIPTLVGNLTPIRVSTPIRAPTPVRTLTRVRTPTPIRTPTPVRTPTLVRTTTPVRASTLVWTPTPVQTLTLDQTRTLVQFPAPALAPAPASASAPAWVPAVVAAAESFLNPVPPLGPLSEPPPEATLSPGNDPAHGPKHDEAPVGTVARPDLEPLSRLTPSGAADLGPALGASPRADPKVAKLTGAPYPWPHRAISTSFHRCTHLRHRELPPGQQNLDSCDLPGEGLPALTPASGDVEVEPSVVSEAMAFGPQYVLLKKSLEQQFPNLLRFEDERVAQATGEFEVFAEGKLVHSKKQGDGFVDEGRLQTIVDAINAEIKRR